jgi:hypothetical protein
MTAKVLDNVDKIKELSERLSKSERVSRYNKPDEPESWTIALAFNDIEESFIKIFDEQLPPLLQGDLSTSMIDQHLHAIGEEFRHILYHIKDCAYYEYLWPDESKGA